MNFIKLILVIVLVLGIGCKKEEAPKETRIKVGLVTDVGKIDDKTFNQSAYEGLIRAQKEFNLITSFIETTQPTDYEKNIQQFIDEGYNIIVTVGFMLGDATAKKAKEHPDVSFAIVDFAVEPALPNVLGLLFSEDQSGFLAGALAALQSKSGIIGFVGGKEIPPVVRFRKGYEAGAKYVRPDIRTLGVYIDSFTDPARGKAAAESQIAEGADVIFGGGGRTGSGAIKAANEKKVYCIGVDTDEYLTTFSGNSAPYLLTSAMKRVDNAVYEAIKLYINKSFHGGSMRGDASNNGIGLAPFHETEKLISPDVRARLDQIQKELAAGTISTGA